jgi:hypothetical protein
LENAVREKMYGEQPHRCHAFPSKSAPAIVLHSFTAYSVKLVTDKNYKEGNREYDSDMAAVLELFKSFSVNDEQGNQWLADFKDLTVDKFMNITAVMANGHNNLRIGNGNVNQHIGDHMDMPPVLVPSEWHDIGGLIMSEGHRKVGVMTQNGISGRWELPPQPLGIDQPQPLGIDQPQPQSLERKCGLNQMADAGDHVKIKKFREGRLKPPNRALIVGTQKMQRICEALNGLVARKLLDGAILGEFLMASPKTTTFNLQNPRKFTDVLGISSTLMDLFAGPFGKSYVADMRDIFPGDGSSGEQTRPRRTTSRARSNSLTPFITFEQPIELTSRAQTDAVAGLMFLDCKSVTRAAKGKGPARSNGADSEKIYGGNHTVAMLRTPHKLTPTSDGGSSTSRRSETNSMNCPGGDSPSVGNNKRSKNGSKGADAKKTRGD